MLSCLSVLYISQKKVPGALERWFLGQSGHQALCPPSMDDPHQSTQAGVSKGAREPSVPQALGCEGPS